MSSNLLRPTSHVPRPTDISRSVTLSPFPLRAPVIARVPSGLTIRQIVYLSLRPSPLAHCPSPDSLIVEINGIPVPSDQWHLIPAVDQHVCIYHALHGNDNTIFRSFLMLAVVVMSIAAPYLAPVSWGLLSAAGGLSMAGSLVSIGVMTAGMMLVNAIAPVRMPTGDTMSPVSEKSQKEVYGITGSQNAVNRFGPVPVVLGTHRMYPLYGAMPYTEIVGNDEYLRMLFIWGYGPLAISDIRIGETAITEYSDVEIETNEGRSTDADLTLIPGTVYQDSINLRLLQVDGRMVRQAHAGANELSVDIVYPSGLFSVATDGTRYKAHCATRVEYREVGAAEWTEATTLDHFQKSIKPIRFGYTWNVDSTKTYEVGLTRLTSDTPSEPTYYDRVMWTSLRSIIDTHPVAFPGYLAMTAIRIKASDQLNGVISTLSGLVSSYATTWTGAAWSGEAVEKNPAALYRMVLMHPANARARTATQINAAQLGAWYDFCTTAGYEFNMVRDAVSSVWSCLADIAAAGRGSPSLSDGTWGVVYDDPDSAVVQHITPRNSWGFSSQKTLFNRPHGFRVRFRNEDNNYEYDERIVYDDGYDETTATLFESIEFPGITSPDLVWKWGRYQIAQARLRPEVYTVSMDFEHLVCRRGSRVKVSHDVPMWGTKWGRITSRTLDGAEENVTAVELDETFTVDGASQYVIRVRMSDSGNTSLLANITTGVAGDYTVATFATPVAVASAPAVGDLCIIGTLTKESQECLVRAITASSDLNATLELVDAAVEVYDADTGPIPAFDTNITPVGDITDLVPGTPSITVQSGTNTLEVTPQGTVRARIFVTCDTSSTDIRIDHYRVRYRLTDSTMWDYAEAPSENPTAYLTDVDEGESYTISAQAVSVYGVSGEWSVAVSHTVVGISELPSDVEYFACNIVGSEAHLSWLPVTDVDLSHYRIRWSPLATGATWGSCIDIVERVGKPATHMTVPAMIGSYLIKAVDYGGNESTNAASATTNISHIPGYTNAELLELPDGSWAGTGDGAGYDAILGGITLTIDESGTYGADLIFEDEASAGFEDTADTSFADQTTAAVALSEGTYTFTDGIDLAGVFTSRVYADMTVSSADILSDLYTLTDLYDSFDLFGAVDGACGIDLEMRFTADDPAGTPVWSAWQRILVGDYTARAFQFRANLWTTIATMTPILEAIDIYIDMADRVHPFGQAIEIGGSAVAFSPPFYAVPSVGIAVSNGVAGDAYTITSLARTGFTIAFTNGGSGVARTISGVARGYGEEDV